MAPPREPVAKLSLNVRKNIRDKYESKVDALKARLQKIGFPEYAFVVNVNQLYAYAEIDYTKENTGACIHEYFDNFIQRLEQFTKDGKDTEAVEALKKVASKNTVNLVPDDNDKYSYNGVEIHDDQIWVVYNASKLGYNISDAANDLQKAIDIAIDAQGGDELPITVRRSIAKYLDSKIPDQQKKIEECLKKPYTLEADVAKNYAFLKAHSADLHNGYLERTPEFIFFYFEAFVSRLQWKGFEKDDMLQEAFNEAAEKGVIRFEIVEKLQHGNYNDCVFEDGELKLQTIVKQFGVNVDNIIDDILDRL